MKSNLIVLSDLYGFEKGDWLSHYVQRLEGHFQIKTYDCRALAEIESTNLPESAIHQQFLARGIDVAVEYLLEKEKKPVFVLAFSIGGAIAWKAALKGLPVLKLTAVSSTRLRKEFRKPSCEIELHYGDQDFHRPMDEWFEKLEIFPEIHFGKAHELYKAQNFIESLCHQMCKKTGN